MSLDVVLTINGKPPHKRHGRKKPYTAKGIVRLPCIRCGGKAFHTWNICADGNIFRPLCIPCDIELNRLVLSWAKDPDRVKKIAAYEVTQYALMGAAWHPDLGWLRIKKTLDELRAFTICIKTGANRIVHRNKLFPDPSNRLRSVWTITHGKQHKS